MSKVVILDERTLSWSVSNLKPLIRDFTVQSCEFLIAAGVMEGAAALNEEVP